MNTNINTVIKVSGKSYYEKFTFESSEKVRENICKLIEDSNLFDHYGKSRIDGYHMYRMKYLTMRRIKMNKIIKKDNLLIKLETLMSKIRDDIDYVTVVDDHIGGWLKKS